MKSLISSLIGLVLSVSAGAEPLLEGRVRLDSGEPVAEAQVQIFDMTDLQRGAIARAMTDGTGYFALPLAALTGSVLPESFTLGQNYPNPFNPSTLIPYQLAASSEVRLEVFNLLGQHIATLVDGERPAGFHTATWHATDAAGRAVGAGVYIYRMRVGVERQTGRMVLLDGQAGVSAGGTASVWSGASGIGRSDGADAHVYGLIVSGSGLVPYVDSAFRVESGMAPVELVVSSGLHSAGKATDDCAFCDLFGALNDQQEEDEDETPEEEAETDSTSSEGGPDLIVQAPSVSAVMLMPGQEFTLNVTVHNQGDEQAAATMLHYYRSNNATITSSDTEVGTDALGALDASATSAKSIALTAPTSVSAEVGIYYGACVASVRGESNTDNNCSSAVKITVSGQEATEEEDETPEEDEETTPEEEEDETPEEEGADGPVSIPDDPTPVTITDANLRAAIAAALGKAADTTITKGEMSALTGGLEAEDAGISDLTGLEFATNLTWLSLGGNNISDLSPLAGLTNLTQLALEGNNISDLSPLAGLTKLTDLGLGGNNISDLSPLAGLTNLTQLTLGGNNISDLSPLRGLTNLTWLTLGNNNIEDVSSLSGLTRLTYLWLSRNNISDLSALRGLTNLTELNLNNNPLSASSINDHIPALQDRGITVTFDPMPVTIPDDPTPVNIPDANLRAAIVAELGKARGATITKGEMSALTSLELSFAGISDLTGLEFATNLTWLSLADNNISDISPLRGLTNLTSLSLSLNNLTDVSPLRGLTNLTSLFLADNNISDISPLSGLANLDWLVLDFNNISDISPLSGLTNLTSLSLSDNNISDISPLLGLTNLTSLQLGFNPIEDVSLLSGLTKLTYLGFWNNNIEDVSLLSGLTKLIYLDLWNNNIEDVSPLSGLTKLTYLDLWNNNIEDVSLLSGLTKLTYLRLGFNSIEDVSPLSGLTKLTYLDLRGNILISSSINDHIPALERSGATVLFDSFRESDFDIELVFLTDFTQFQKRMIEYAARRWMSIIRKDLPDYTFTQGRSSVCGDHSYRIPAGERIDDLRIYITSSDRSGPSGWGGPNVLRETSHLSVVGCMGFDLVINNSYLVNLALHEIGHVLGVGTLWDDSGFLQNPSENNSNADTHFNGPLAIAAFNDAGGWDYSGAKVPVHRQGGPRAADSHWRSSVLEGELMSLSGSAVVALSAITVQSLADLGYSVDVTQADPYTLPLAAAKASAKITALPTHAPPKLLCGVGEQREPIYVVDEQGNIIRTLHR